MKATDSFYFSQAWKRCRSAYIAERHGIDGGMCEICHDNLGYIVHHKIHITPFNMNDTNITLNTDNLQYVCHHCHDVIHGYANQQKNENRITFDALGNVIPKAPPV